MADADKKSKVQIEIEAVVNKEQVKQEIETVQKIADANKVTVPVEIEEVSFKDITQEVKAVQKTTNKTPVEVPVKLTKKEVQGELNKLIKQKGKSQEEIRVKLDEIMKGMDLSDVIKDSIKNLFVKYRSMANSKKGFSSASIKSKDELVEFATKFSKQTRSKTTNAMVRALTELTAEQTQVYRNEKLTSLKPQKSRQVARNKLIETTKGKEEARTKLSKTRTEYDKITRFVEGMQDPENPSKWLSGTKELYSKMLDDLYGLHNEKMRLTDSGKNEKAVKFWGDPAELADFIKRIETALNKGLTAYNNKDTMLTKAITEYKEAVTELETIETEMIEELKAMNKQLKPKDKLLINPSSAIAKKYGDIFKESTPSPKKFTLRKRTLTDDVADAAINRDYLKKLKRGASRGKANVPGADTNLGLRQSIMDGPYVDKQRIIRTAIGGPYADTNSYSRLASETQKASYELAEKTFVRFFMTMEELVAHKAREDKIQGHNKNDISEIDKSRHLSQITTNQAVDEQKKITKGLPLASKEVFQKALDASFGFLTTSHGPSLWKGLAQNTNATMMPFAGGTFKITDDETKGEGSNYAELREVLKENFKGVNNFFDKNPQKEQLAEITRQLKIAASISQDAYEQLLSDYAPLLISFGYKVGKSTTKKSDSTPTSPLSGNTMLNKLIPGLAEKIETQIEYTQLGNIETEMNTEAIKTTDTTGADSNAGKDEIVNATKEVSKTIRDIVANISGSGFGGFGGSGGSDGRIPPTREGGNGSVPPYQNILEQIAQSLDNIDINLGNVLQGLIAAGMKLPTSALTLVEGQGVITHPVEKVATEAATKVATETTVSDKVKSEVKKETNAEASRDKKPQELPQRSNRMSTTEVVTSRKGILGVLDKILKQIQPISEVDRIMSMNAEQQALARAERIEKFGENRGRDLKDTGDIASVRRTKELFGWIYSSDKDNQELFQDIKLTEGFTGKNTVDTTKIMLALNKVLSGPEMFKAQTGGVLKNIIGSMTGYIGVPSLEKSRTQAEGLNQVMANVRTDVLALLQDIQAKEAALKGMEARGTAVFGEDGSLVSGSSVARKVLADYEEQKSVLRNALIEVQMIDEVIGKTGGKVSAIVKNIGFVMPELMQNNTILQNINAGLDKNGKALKFQSRTAEILNYAFQLMSRHVGQIFKNWMMQINPLNNIVRIFNDFASYDAKWQRTMNVVKYNFRDVVRPFVEWIAQQLVNIIGFVDIILQKIQVAFGRKPVSLFDQENANKVKKTYEDIANISAGFDELHDIGSSTSENNPDDLFGEIYKPQLSQEWIDFAKKLGDIFTGIAKAIKWCIDNWELFVVLLAGFVITKGLWNLLNFALNLGRAFGGLANVPWGSIAKGLGWVAAAAATAASAYETVKLGNKWDQMDDKEKDSTVGKSVGFGTLAGGIIGTLIAPGVGTAIGAGLGAAITGGIDSAISDYNGDDARAELTGALGGAGLGAAIGTLIAPGIGTAVGAAIGTGVGWGIEKLGHMTFSNGGDYSNLKISTEDLAWANDQLTTAQDNATKSAYNLKYAEEQIGQSGKELYDTIKTGKITLDDLSSSQVAVYDAYKTHIETLDELKGAQQTQMDYETAMDLDRAEKSDNYNDYINKMIEANNNGIYSSEELQDRFAQVYGELDRNSRQVFLEQLPENMRQSIELQGQNYLSNWNKFYDDCCTNWENFKTGWGQFWNGVGETVSTKWEDMKTVAGNVWNSIKIEASETWESIKNSAIGQKVQETWKNVTTKFNDIKTSLSTSWNSLKGTASTAWNSIKTTIVNAAQNAWNGAKGFFSKIADGIAKAWEGLKELARETGQKIGNFFSGNGFKTDAEVSSRSVPSMSVGTNYVPNDGLVYLHQGEAVIPKKYNQPYQPGALSPEEQLYMNQMINTMRSLDNTMKQGINVNGQFVQRGSDLVAVVNKTKSQTGADLLSNVAYAR